MTECLGDKLPATWWRDPELLKHEYIAHRNLSAIETAHGPSLQALSNWWRKHGFPPLPHGSAPDSVKPFIVVEEREREDGTDEWLLKVLKRSGDSATVEELADAADCSPRRVREALERLGHQGYRVAEEAERVVLRRVPPPSDNVHRLLFAGETIRFGVVSDTHLGSKHERLDELHHAYKVFADEGITDVFHPGDLVCGYGIFPGQVNEVDLHTYEDQVAYAVENYPKADGITTRIISGNHDIEGQFGKIGANPVVAFCNQRDDFEFLGDYRAAIELEQGTRIYMLHPKGGMGYAADYKLRKLAEGFEAGSKPNVMLVGHFHRRGAFEARGIQMLMCGCFESGGSFGVRLGMSDPAVGFHIVEMTVGDDGSVVKFNPTWWRFWPGREVKAAA